MMNSTQGPIKNTSNQIKLIVWKNILIRKRHWPLTLCEALLPVLLFLLVAYGRSQITGLSKQNITEVTYNEKFPISYDSFGFNLEETQFYYAPSDNYFSDIIHRVQEKFQIINNNIKRFPNDHKLTESYLKGNDTSVVAIVFHSKPGNKRFDYTIRVHIPYVNWRTGRLFEDVYSFEPGKGSEYSWRGFLALQKALDMSFIEKEAEALGRLVPTIDLESQEFPYPPYRSDSGSAAFFATYLPLLTLLSFIFVCPAVLQRVVEEKHTGVKELMKMVGMKPWPSWFGWFIYSIIPMFISVTLIVVLLKVDIFRVGYPPIEYTSSSMLAMFLLLYCITVTLTCFSLSTLFNKPTLATLVGLLFWILSYFVPKYLSEDVCALPYYFRFVLMLFPNMALHFGFNAISQYEVREIGLQWNNWHLPGGGSSSDLTMLQVCIMLLVDCALNIAFTLYLDPLSPGQYGVPKSMFFPFKGIRSWFKSKNADEIAEDMEMMLKEKPYAHIQAYNLTKQYGQREVVQDVSMDIHKNSITVLLGHNGAGKSTVMGMITGMIKKSGGNIYINDQKIHSGSDVTHSIGLCPQYNLFFSDLTVAEHLKFFAMLKGRNSKEAEEEIDSLLKTLKLEDKKHKLPHTLSGGMQRKLCLGMAVVGGSEILILDEPSSGMDTLARRDMWDLLLQWRKEKTILITTHFMDEADALADRVVILDQGKTAFEGTLSELKKKFAEGHVLRLLINEDADTNKAKDTIVAKLSQTDFVEKIWNETVDGHEVKLSVTAKDYSKLFEQLETEKEELHIEVMSFSNATVEDAIQEYEIRKLDDSKSVKHIKSIKQKICGMTKTSGGNTFLTLWALYCKKTSFIVNKRITYIIPAIFAALFFGLTIVLGQSQTYINNGGSNLNLSLNVYGNTTVFCSDLHSSLNCQAQYKESVRNRKCNFSIQKNISSAIVEQGVKNLPFYQHRMVAGAEFYKSDNQSIEATVLYNGVAIHSAPISLNLMTNTIAKQVLGEAYTIGSTSIHPLPSIGSSAPEELHQSQIGLLWLIILPMGFLFLLGTFIYFPHKEISTKFARIQFISGVRPSVYWVFTYFHDLVIYSAIVGGLSCMIFSWVPFRGLEEWGTFLLILICYGATGIPCAYLFSRRKSFSDAYAMFIILGLMSGVLLTEVVIVLEESKDELYMNLGRILKIVFMIINPQFALTHSGVTFSIKAVKNYNFERMDKSRLIIECMREDPSPCCFEDRNAECEAEKSYFSVLLPQLWFVLLGAVFFLLLNIFIDSYTVQIIWHRFRNFIRCRFYLFENNCPEMAKCENALCVSKLKKSYSGKPVVDEVDFNMNNGECVGILGVNGAGKSTTFRMLTREEIRDGGSITIGNVNIDRDKYLNKIGYCPQNDALNYTLTGKQLLKTMAMLRGINNNDEMVVDLLDIFGLSEIANFPCSTYSGGNKRKLSFAVSIIGLPDFVLLDEPTNGVDPLSRRKFWTLINEIKKGKASSFILTSHSMSECEALCNKLYIMNEGKVQTSGSVTKLKSEQSRFNVTFRRKGDKTVSDDLLERIKDLGGNIKDEHHSELSIQVHSQKMSWSQLYKKCDKLKRDYSSLLDDYTINEASLEEIFLDVANNKTMHQTAS